MCAHALISLGLHRVARVSLPFRCNKIHKTDKLQTANSLQHYVAKPEHSQACKDLSSRSRMPCKHLSNYTSTRIIHPQGFLRIRGRPHSPSPAPRRRGRGMMSKEGQDTRGWALGESLMARHKLPSTGVSVCNLLDLYASLDALLLACPCCPPKLALRSLFHLSPMDRCIRV